MASENSQNRVAWPVAFGEYPRKGSRSMYQLLDFSLENPININLSYEEESSRLEFVQTIFIDNSGNPSALVCTMGSTGQVLRIPGGWQGYVPVLASSDKTRMTFTTTFSAENAPQIPIFFLSFPAPLDLWPASVGSTGTDYSANKPSAYANLLATVPINGRRASVNVQNQSANQIQVVLDDGAGGNVSYILLAPGSGANVQGAGYTSTTFKGRLQIKGQSSGDQVGIYED